MEWPGFTVGHHQSGLAEQYGDRPSSFRCVRGSSTRPSSQTCSPHDLHIVSVFSNRCAGTSSGFGTVRSEHTAGSEFPSACFNVDSGTALPMVWNGMESCTVPAGVEYRSGGSGSWLWFLRMFSCYFGWGLVGARRCLLNGVGSMNAYYTRRWPARGIWLLRRDCWLANRVVSLRCGR